MQNYMMITITQFSEQVEIMLLSSI